MSALHHRRQIATWTLATLVAAALLAALLNGSVGLVRGGDQDRADWSQHVGYAEAAARAVRTDHELPFWNPMPCGGIPILANTQSRVMTPFFLLHLVLRPGLALRWEVLLHSFLGALGAALLSRRFVRVRGHARALVAALAAFGFAATTAFTLHLGEGHSWMLAGAYLPWVLWSFDRALEALGADDTPRALRDAGICGALLALMLGEGGIYPAPQAALAITILAAASAAARRSLRPFVLVVVAAIVAVLLGAPKLLPMLEFIGRRPRIIDSTEEISFLRIVTALVSRDQKTPRLIPDWGWHELGSYVGVAQLLLALVAIVGQRRRLAPMTWLTLIGGALALGQFAPWAPWALLHMVPIFHSQHVPSRFLFVVVVAVIALAPAGLAELVRRVRSPRLRLGLAAVSVALVAGDLVRVGEGAFGATTPPPAWTAVAPHSDRWTTFRGPPCAYLEGGCDDRRAGLAEAVRRGVSLIDAYEPACVRPDTRINFGRSPGLIGVGEAGYRGEAWLREGRGTVRIVARTMSTTTVELETDAPATIVFNQNGDPGWSGDVGVVATDEDQRLLWRVPATHGMERHLLRYLPPYFGAGVAAFVAGVGLLGALVARARRPLPA